MNSISPDRFHIEEPLAILAVAVGTVGPPARKHL